MNGGIQHLQALLLTHLPQLLHFQNRKPAQPELLQCDVRELEALCFEKDRVEEGWKLEPEQMVQDAEILLVLLHVVQLPELYFLPVVFHCRKNVADKQVLLLRLQFPLLYVVE